MGARGDADKTELPFENVHAVVPIADFFIHDERDNPIAGRTIPINEIFADQLIPATEAVRPVRNPASITSSVPFNPARAGIEDVSQRRLRKAWAFDQRPDGLLLLKVANRLCHCSRADPKSGRTFSHNGGVCLRLSASQIHLLQNRSLNRASEGSPGGQKKNEGGTEEQRHSDFG